MTIQFDDGAAITLANAASTTASALHDQGWARRSAAENAAEHFSGGYAHLFTDACAIEAADRGKLAGVLGSLADQVLDAKQKAADERARLAAHQAWQDREDLRDHQRRAEFLSGTVSATPEPFDPKPSTGPIGPPTVSASFSARQHNRSSGSSASGKSSADPSQLRAFVTHTRAANNALASECTALQNAWSSFTGSCSWVHLGSGSFLQGFQNLLLESQADAAWAETIASAFEHAGGGSLSDADLTLAWAAKVDPTSTQNAIDKLTPSEREALSLLDWVAKSFTDQVTLNDEDPLGLSLWASGHFATGSEGAATWFKNFKYGRLAPRVNGRFVPLADTLPGRGQQALDPKNWVAKPYSAGVRAFLSRIETMAKWGGPALSAAGGGAAQWQMDEGTGYEMDERLTRVGTRAFAVGLGTWGGATLGFKGGSRIGRILGPLGVVIGGLAGGIGGGIVGTGAGNAAADLVVDTFGNWGDSFSELGNNLKFWG